MVALADTGGLFALADRDDDAHTPVSDYLTHSRQDLIVPVTVLTEVDYLIADRLGVRVELAMLRSVDRGDLRFEPVTPADLKRAIELIEQYSDSSIGLVDASIVAIAERLGITRILTLDHRHFRMFRPRHCDAFDLVP